MRDIRYALDELERPSRDIHSRLTDAANLDAQSEDEFFNRLLQYRNALHGILKG